MANEDTLHHQHLDMAPPLVAELALFLLDATHCDAFGARYDPRFYPPEDGEWLASVTFEADPTLDSTFRCTGLDDAEAAIRAAMPTRNIVFTRDASELDYCEECSGPPPSIKRLYVRHYRDNGQTTAYVEWSDGSRTEGPAQRSTMFPTGAHLAALFRRGQAEGLQVGYEVY